MTMDIPSAIATSLPRAMGALRDAYRRDRANAYALLEPWTLPPLGGDLPELGLMPPAPYADARIRVEFGTTEDTEDTEGAWRITVLPWELDSRECDGCTLAPDSWGELRLYVAALFHDRWYLSMDAIAARWGWPVRRVRRLGDIVFATLIRSLATGLPWASRMRARLAAWLYYRGVRAFGGIAHDMMQTTSSSPGGGGGISPLLLSPAPVALAGLLLLGAGCSGGCSPIPLAWDDNVGLYRLEYPAVAFTNSVTGAHFETVRPSDPQTEGGAE